MREFWFAVAVVVSALMIGPARADDKDKAKGEPPTALAPSPLDDAFQRATSEKDINDNLLNNDLYKKAVKAALKAKRGIEEQMKANPKLVGPSPAQAARSMFLMVLRGEATESTDK